VAVSKDGLQYRFVIPGTSVLAVGFDTEYHITMAHETLPVMKSFVVWFWHFSEVNGRGDDVRSSG